jgi:tetratricopeptide (TPR) repeat protein
MARAHFGEKNLAVADALGQVGRALFFLREIDEAETFTRQTLAMQRKLRGEDSLQEAVALHLLADVLRHLALHAKDGEGKDKLAEAETDIRASIAMLRKHPGNTNDEVAWAFVTLSLVLGDESKNGEAEDAIREALATFRKLHGDEHPFTAYTYMCLGIRVTKADDAEAYLRRALEIQVRTEGEGKLDQHISHFNLASVLEGQGKLDEAEIHYRAALAIAREQMGPEYLDLSSGPDLANLLRKQGKLAEARVLAEEAVAICRRHPDRVDRWVKDRSFAALGSVLTDLGDTNALEKLDLTVQQMNAKPKPAPAPDSQAK